MIVVRFKATCKPEMIDKAIAMFTAAIAPSRMVEGVINFDIARDLSDPNSLIATEVFDDEEAMARQEAQPVIQAIMAQMPEFLAAGPEATVYQVSSTSQPFG